MPRPHSITISNSTGSEHITLSDEEGHSGVHVRYSSSDTDSRSLSSSVVSEEDWTQIDRYDEIEPSDSASRPRHSSRHAVVQAQPRPQPTRRKSSTRIDTIRDEHSPPRRSSHRSQSDRREHREHKERRERRDHGEYREHRSHREHREHRHRESRRTPSSSDGSGSVDSPYEDQGYAHPFAAHRPPHPGHSHSYAVPPHAPAPGAYPPQPGMMPGQGHGDPFTSALVHVPQQDAFGAGGYPHNPHANPFGVASPPISHSGSTANPFSPLSTGSQASGYFGQDPHGSHPSLVSHQPTHRSHSHHRPHVPRPQSFAGVPPGYGGELTPYGYPGPYGMPGMPPPGYPPHMAYYGYPHPSHTPSPAPPAETPRKAKTPPPEPAAPPVNTKKDEDFAKMTEMMKKMEEERMAMQKKMQEEQAALIKKYEDERIAREKAAEAKAAAEKAEEERKKAKAAEEKLKAEQIEAAAKAAKEAAEKDAAEKAKKAKEASDKAIAEAKKAAEEAEKAKKALEEEVEKNKPLPDMAQPPIKFKDAVGRKFSFPWHLCKSWKGMEALIKQAFLHVDVIGQHVQEGHYDLTGPDGEIILPQVWDTMVKPDWEISMHMWPMPEPSAVAPSKEPEAVLPEAVIMPGAFDPLSMIIPDPAPPKKAGKKDKDKSAKAKRASAVIEPGVIVVPSAPPAGAHSIPPPPMHGLFPDPLGAAGAALPPGIVAVVEPEAAQAVSQKKSSKKSSKPLPPLAAWIAGSSSRGRARAK